MGKFMKIATVIFSSYFFGGLQDPYILSLNLKNCIFLRFLFKATSLGDI